MMPGYCRAGEMSAMVTALTHVVSGTRMTPGGGGERSSSSAPASYPALPWVVGQKRGRERDGSAGTSSTGPQLPETVTRFYGGFGEFTASSESSSGAPTGELSNPLDSNYIDSKTQQVSRP